jgi:hypothetical protein
MKIKNGHSVLLLRSSDLISLILISVGDLISLTLTELLLA